MKKIFYLCFLFLLQTDLLHAQILQRIKDQVKWKAEQKAMEKINQGIDNVVDSAGKKIKSKKKGRKKSETELTESEQPTDNAEGKTAAGKKEESKNQQGEGEGFLELRLSADKIFVGGVVKISGKSFLYKEYNSIEINISGKNYTEQKNIKLDKDGGYNTIWNVPGKEGDYIVTAFSSDKKVTRKEKITVYELPELEGMADENIEQTNKAYEKVKEKSQHLKGMISAAQATELDKKISDFTDKKDVAIKFFNSVKEANKKLAQMAKKGKVLPRVLSQNLSELNTHLKKQSDEMKQAHEFLNHEPADNSICEYLVMLNEACAAFSTFSAFWEKSVEGVLKNIVLDKIPPMVVGNANEMVGKPIPEPADFIPKESAKLFTTALVDLESFSTKKGKAGIAGDLIGFFTDVLMKIFCGVYKGEVTHSYTMNYRNKDGNTFWKYGVEMKAVINLRYPKNKNTGRIIKMKGSIEGNATKFTFFANPKEAVAEELKASNRYNMVETYALYNYTPFAVPFSAVQKDNMGFGAVARGIFTPAAFYIPIDAEYDQDAHKIKLFINKAILDFTPFIENKQFYVILAVLPLFRVTNYPIEKAEKTIRGSLKEKNYFIMKGEAQGKPQFDGTITREIKDPEFEINLKITVKAAKD